MASKKRKRKVPKNNKYNPRTINITPFLVKLLFVFIVVYSLYGAVFYMVWGVLPYTFGYTLYVSDEGFIGNSYVVEKGDILLVKQYDVRSDGNLEGNLLVSREGREYRLTESTRRPYGIVVDFRSLLKNWVKLNKIF